MKYIETVTDELVNRFLFLIKGLFDYTVALIIGCPFVYIHSSSYNSFRRKSLFICIALLFRTKIILHIHPSHFYQFLSECRGLEKRFIYFLLKRIDIFVVITEEMKKNIQKLLPDKQIIILRNPIDLDKMENSGSYKRLSDRILYLGWYIKEKGVYELVDAIEILINNSVKIQADFYGAKKIDKLRSYVENKGLKEKIRINGWINNGKKLKALYECTALILPSHSEGVPNVILEAMATKTPIISTLVGGLKEILRDGENAFITEVNNPKDLSRKILKCLVDKELRDKLAGYAYQNVCMQNDVKKIKKDFEKIVERL